MVVKCVCVSMRVEIELNQIGRPFMHLLPDYIHYSPAISWTFWLYLIWWQQQNNFLVRQRRRIFCIINLLWSFSTEHKMKGSIYRRTQSCGNCGRLWFDKLSKENDVDRRIKKRRTNARSRSCFSVSLRSVQHRKCCWKMLLLHFRIFHCLPHTDFRYRKVLSHTHTYRCAGICKTFVLAGAAGSKASRRVLLKRKQAKLRVDCNGKKGGKSPSPNPNIYVCV